MRLTKPLQNGAVFFDVESMALNCAMKARYEDTHRQTVSEAQAIRRDKFQLIYGKYIDGDKDL